MASAVVTSMFCWELFCTNCSRSPVLLISWVVLAMNRQRSQLGMSDLAQWVLGALLQWGARQSRAWAWRQLFSEWQEMGLTDAFLDCCLLPSSPNRYTIISHSLHLFGISASFFLSGLKCNRDRGCPVDLRCRGSFGYTGKHQVKRGDSRFKPGKRKYFLWQHVF